MQSLPDLVQARALGQSGRARRLRERAHVSIPELAAVLGVEPSTLSRWERGVRSPRPEAAAAWLQALREIAPRAVR